MGCRSLIYKTELMVHFLNKSERAIRCVGKLCSFIFKID